MIDKFVGLVGFSLGILIVCVTLRVLFAPVKVIFKVVLNSIIGAVVLVILNRIFSHTGVFIGVNPVSSLTVGILGVPGLVLLLILQAVF